MKPSAYIIVILIFASALAYLVSAEEMNYQSNPGYQTLPNMTAGSPGEEISASQRHGQQGQQGMEQTGGQSSPTHISTEIPGVQSEKISVSDTTPQTTRQPVPSQTEQPMTQGPQKNPTSVENPGLNQKEPVQTNQPAQKVQEQKQSPVQPVTQQPDSQYHTIPIPPSYPEFRQDHAAVQVTSSPTGASVYIDGSYKGITPSSGYLEISDLSPGKYTIHLTLTGYTDYTTEITLFKNEVSTISADMTSTYVPSEYGALLVQSIPTGADVYLDNEYKGITPVTLQGIRTGSHSVLVKSNGYSSYSGDVYIVSDQASTLSITLTAIVTQTQAPIPTLLPVPEPKKSPISPLVVVYGLVTAGIGFAAQRKQ